MILRKYSEKLEYSIRMTNQSKRCDIVSWLPKYCFSKLESLHY